MSEIADTTVDNKIEETMDFYDVIKNQFLKLSELLLNELELSFEYVPVSNIEAIRNKLTESNNEDFKILVSQIQNELKQYKDELSYIVKTNTKIKTNKFSFINDIKLFKLDNDICIDFSLFKEENKNTKKTLIQYLFNLYTSCVYLEMCDLNDTDENIVLKIQDFVNTFSINKDNGSNEVTEENVLNQGNANPNLNQNDILESLLGNKHLVELANDISKNIEENNINPLSLLTSMMSGKQDKNIENLIHSLSNKLETKIANGDLNKEELQKNANDFLSSGELLNGMPFLGDLMKNMTMSGNKNKRHVVRRK